MASVSRVQNLIKKVYVHSDTFVKSNNPFSFCPTPHMSRNLLMIMEVLLMLGVLCKNNLQS